MDDKIIQFPGSKKDKISEMGVAKCERLVGKVVRNKEFCISSLILFARKNEKNEVEYLLTTEEGMIFLTEEELFAQWELVE